MGEQGRQPDGSGGEAAGVPRPGAVDDDAILYSATLEFQLWVSPAGHTHGFSARIIGGRLLSVREFSDREAFVQLVERVTEAQPGPW